MIKSSTFEEMTGLINFSFNSELFNNPFANLTIPTIATAITGTTTTTTAIVRSS